MEKEIQGHVEPVNELTDNVIKKAYHTLPFNNFQQTFSKITFAITTVVLVGLYIILYPIFRLQEI